MVGLYFAPVAWLTVGLVLGFMLGAILAVAYAGEKYLAEEMRARGSQILSELARDELLRRIVELEAATAELEDAVFEDEDDEEDRAGDESAGNGGRAA